MEPTSWVLSLIKPLLTLLNSIVQHLNEWLGHKRKPHLYVHFNIGQLVWGIASDGQNEMMQVISWADINHDDPKNALIITDAYPQAPSLK